MPRAAMLAGALTLIVAGPADAGVFKKRLHARVGKTVAVVGSGQPGVAELQIRRRGVWRTIDRDRTTATGRYVLRDRVRRPMSVFVRVVTGSDPHRIGRLNAYRVTSASWYGPGLYGNHLGCGGTLTSAKLGVAHRSLPCGSKVTLRHGDRTVRVRVIDRGPYVGGREFDLTEATARKLRFRGHGTLLTTR
jgi:rare lipoprotein A